MARAHRRLGLRLLSSVMLGKLGITQLLPSANVLFCGDGDLVAECPARIPAVRAGNRLLMLRR